MRIYLLLFIFWAASSLAQTVGIPTEYMNDPAVDLVYNGSLLYPEEAHALKEKFKGKFDLADLNPVESSDLWRDEYLKQLPPASIQVNNFSEVEYISPLLSPSGIFRFNVTHSKDKKIYTMMLSKTVHSVLLAQGLLRKIGYQIPEVKYLSKSVLKFKDEKEKRTFLSYLENVAFAGSASNWVIEEIEENKVLIQDLVVMDSSHLIYNLAFGVTPEIVQGRRLLSSVVVPLSIINLTESVNMFRWTVGQKNRKEIFLYHDEAASFQCTWDDARWILKRIEKLTRDDWREIVEGSHTPRPVQDILLEKIISRRNSAMKLFKVDAREIKVDANVSNGVELVKGKLTQDEWEGYAPRFAYGDPDSPLANSEMRSFIKSKAVSTVLDLAVSGINQLPFLGTDINQINNDKYQSLVKSTIEKSIKNNTPGELPLSGWVFPTVRGQMILSRNIMTGTYLGTDNLVQLVDTVGVAVGAGAYAGVAGLPLPFKASASGEVSFVRTYSHLRPVTSIQKSLKYPFKNILVPIVKRDYGKKLHEAVQNPDHIDEALKPFKDSMDIGESIIVTDALSTQVAGIIGAGYKNLVSASLGLIPGHVVVSRFHVHRKSEHEFQVYRDFGESGSLGIAFKFDSLVPILSISSKSVKGNARVKFYNLNLHPENPDVIENISLLRRAIVHSSTQGFDKTKKHRPFIVKHKFKEKTPKLNLLFWQWQWLKSSTKISVENPHGDERYFNRQYHGKTQGKSYQKYVSSLVSHWVGLLFNKKASILESGDNPGHSFKGQAKTRFLTLDEEVDRNGHTIEPFVRLTRVSNGWSIDKKNANKILDEIRTRYRHDFYSGPVLNDTQRIFLYNISVNLFFYKEGIAHLIDLPEGEVKRIFRENQVQTNLVINPARLDDSQTGVVKFLKFRKKFLKYEKSGKIELANKYLMKTLSQAEFKVNLKGLIELVGGEDHLFVNSKIDGFREGDEDGDRAIVSDTVGEFGSPNFLGPIMQVQRQTEMLEGEFFIYWMMTRLI